MFRKETSGKPSFSWNRLVLNTFPNFSNDSKDDVELSTKEQDDLFRFQVVQPEPRILNAQSFFIGGVVGMVNNFSPFLAQSRVCSKSHASHHFCQRHIEQALLTTRD